MEINAKNMRSLTEDAQKAMYVYTIEGIEQKIEACAKRGEDTYTCDPSDLQLLGGYKKNLKQYFKNLGFKVKTISDRDIFDNTITERTLRISW